MAKTKIPRNSIKGYTYQQSIFILFLGIMDTQKNIGKIVVEATDTKHFDDLYLQNVIDVDGTEKSYRLQVKNYPKATTDNISITDHFVTLRGNENEYDPVDNNILVVNSKNIKTEGEFMGLPSLKKENIIIIPITPEQCADLFDNMFSTDERALQIIHKADEITQNAKFEISQEDLPKFISLSIDMGDNTVFIRKVPEIIPNEITLVEGNPGIGKSHFVNELCEKYPEAIVYRFWTGSQDPFVNDRLRFERFIIEMGIKVFDSPKKVILDELIETIKRENKIIIIDGLDHVENYNYKELDKFIGFINNLSEIRCIVLSRPIRTQLPWNKINLLNWSAEETRLYLELQYQIVDYSIISKIFEYTNGYPIITKFIAEDYLKNNKLNVGETTIESIEDYYSSLFINGEKPSSAISVFAAGNCFFTWNELSGFFEGSEMFDIVQEFIETHPYLFKIVRNRVSLIHDSFNTYIRMKLPTYSKRRDQILKVVSDSLLSGSVEYMDRMKAFMLDDDFYRLLIKKYSDSDEFTRLMKSTQDYNSISSLYVQLRNKLVDFSDLLNIYQLYSFALLFEISQRNDLIGSDSLIYQMLVYMKLHEGVEDSIYSNGFEWNAYLYLCGDERSARLYLEDMHYSESQFEQFKETVYTDDIFFDKKDIIITADVLKQKLINMDYMYAYKLLADYFVSVWIHGKSKDFLYEEVFAYVDGNNAMSNFIWEQLAPYNVDICNVRIALSTAKYQLYELGYFEENNRFLNKTLEEVIRENAKFGSFDVETYVASYLKLANYEKREVDIENLAYVWSMYYQRKDYSVYSIDKALVVFEENGLVDENISFQIIERLQEQSEKGIHHLATQYVNIKNNDFINKLRASNYFSKDNVVNFWDLLPEKIDCFSWNEFRDKMISLFRRNCSTKDIMYIDLSNALNSKYKDIILNGVDYLDFSIISPDEELIEELEMRGISFIVGEKLEEPEYEPFRNGYIHEEDFEFIKENKISCIDVSKFADGWYTCLPFVEVFALYPEEEIQEKSLSILHTAMFARCLNDTYIGNWYQIIGNVPEFLQRYKVDVDFLRLYNVFVKFLDISLIWHV